MGVTDGGRSPVAVALGSNLEPRAVHLASAVTWVDGVLEGVVRSGVYESAPREGVEGPAFLNMCVTGRTDLSPGELLEGLLARERRQGRVRRPGTGRARTLDLDLLFYESRIIVRDGLEVPHPRMTRRAFVLVPLAEIAAEWHHPVVGRSVAELAGSVDRGGIRRLGDAVDVLDA